MRPVPDLLKKRVESHYCWRKRQRTTVHRGINNTTAVLWYVSEINNECVRFSVLHRHIIIIKCLWYTQIQPKDGVLRLYIHVHAEVYLWCNGVPYFFRSMSIVTAKRLKILYQITCMLNRRQIFLMKNRQIFGQNDTNLSIIQHPTKGA